MTDYPWANLPAMFFEIADRLGDKPFLWAKRGGPYQSVSWTEAANNVTALASRLQTLGVGVGDRIVLVSENRPEWVIADMAIMTVGAITVPAYVTNTTADHLHVLTDSGACGIIVSTRRLSGKLIPAARQAAAPRFLISIEPTPTRPDDTFDTLCWQHCLRPVAADDPDKLDAQTRQLANRWSDRETACIIYTSGTGGLPKGVMLTHRNLFHNIMGARDALTGIDLGDEVFLSFLPMSHSYEHTAGQLFPISIGAQIYFAEGIEALGSNMQEARPTIMTAVPRLYETMYQRISQGVRKSGGLKESMFNATLRTGRKKYTVQGQLGGLEKLLDRLLDRLVRDKVRARFGGRLKALVSGGAPLNPEIGIYFTALGMRLLQGYGQTETSPVISVNRPDNAKMHTVGPPLLNTDVRIADDGEILAGGDLVMKGYWNDDEATARVIQDGWVHTGDIGRIDEDGHLIITDRKKDIIVNSGGDNIAPQRVEGILALQPEIFQALVYGDKRPHLVAVLVADRNWLQEQDGDLHKALQPAVDRANEQLSPLEKVRRYIVADTPFSIENGQFTPTMKVRRHVVIEHYGERLTGLYPKPAGRQAP